MKATTEWKTYRTRFLVKATQLTQSLRFVDVLGREHAGQKGDYLVESSDGFLRIAPRQLFEDVYVAMDPSDQNATRAGVGRRKWPTGSQASPSAAPRPLAV